MFVLLMVTAAGVTYAGACVGSVAGQDTGRTCADDGHDCTLTCSGTWACRGMTIHGPPHPHKLHVICTGGGGNTCYLIQVHGEASAGVRFTCETTGYSCGNGANIFCPGRTQNPDGGCDPAAGSAGGAADDLCILRRPASLTGQPCTCEAMSLHIGPRRPRLPSPHPTEYHRPRPRSPRAGGARRTRAGGAGRRGGGACAGTLDSHTPDAPPRRTRGPSSGRWTTSSCSRRCSCRCVCVRGSGVCVRHDVSHTTQCDGP